MYNSKLFVALAFIFGIFFAPLVSADTFSASIQSLSPGNTVFAKSKVTFSIVTSGFAAQSYQITDSFSGSSATVNNIDGGGNFSWVPLVSDAGTHALSITSHDFSGNSATTVLTITVNPPPSLSIQSLSSNSVKSGQNVTFHAAAIGFTNPSFIIGDISSGSTISDHNLDASGNFSWTPEISDNGKHSITIYVSDSSGHSAQATLDIQVGAGPTLLVQPVTPGTTVNAGTTVSFTVAAINFIPTGFTVRDSFSGSSVSNGNINSSGNFVWTPSGNDVGTHVLIFGGQVGAFGDSATTSQTLYVVASGASTTSPPVTTPASLPGAASSSVLSVLQAQLAALNAKILSQSGSVTPPSPATSGFTFTTYLHPGSQGDEVTNLQNILIQEGFLAGAPTGYYGSLTVDAVSKFQAAHHLTQLGVVGPATRAALNSLGSAAVSTSVSAPSPDSYVFQHFMGYGDDDSDVLELQTRLTALGFLTAAPSGFYGNATVAAVKKFQAAHKLPVVGYVDTATRAALNQ